MKKEEKQQHDFIFPKKNYHIYVYWIGGNCPWIYPYERWRQ